MNEQMSVLNFPMTENNLKLNLAFPRKIDPYLVLLVLFSLFAIGPLLGPGYFWGAHDGRINVYFLFEFDRVIQDGILYPRWLPDFTFGYGYPFFNIYGPGAFYIGEAFHLIGFDLVTATKIVFGLAIVTSGITMFGFVRRLTGSSQAAFISGLLYIYLPYHVLDLYVRAALEESVALVFLPLAFWGLYETALRPRRMSIVGAALAYAAMLLSHSVTTILSTPVLALWVLSLMIGEVRKRPVAMTPKLALSSLIKSGLAPLASILLGVGLASISFIPAVFEYQFVRQDQWFGNYYSFTNHFIYLHQLFSPLWGFGISGPGPRDGMSFQLGVMPVLLLCLSSIAIARNSRGLRQHWLFFIAVVVTVVLLTLTSALPIWQALPFLSYAQFPWRLLALTTVPLAVLGGAIVTEDEQTRAGAGLSLPTILLGALILLGSYPYLTAQTQLEAKEGPVSFAGLMKFQQSAGEMTGSTVWVKEIPTWSYLADVWLAGKRVKTKLVLTDYPEDVLQAIPLPNMTGMHANGERIVLHVAQDNLPVRFNMFYYPGWRAYLVKAGTTDIIRELPIETVGEQGQIQVRMPKGREQWLMLRFDDTPPRMAGGWISALSILLSLTLIIWEVRVRRQGRE